MSIENSISPGERYIREDTDLSGPNVFNGYANPPHEDALDPQTEELQLKFWNGEGPVHPDDQGMSFPEVSDQE